MTPPELQVGDALFLDFDGTLVEIAEHPERVLLPIELPALLAAVRERLDGALALVSGRRLDDVDRMLGPLRFAGAGLLGSSIMGFHTQLHCNNFLDAADRFLESRIDREDQAIIQNQRKTQIRPYPISIEWPNQWARQAPPVSECRASVIADLGLRADALIGVGIDRLDYTKGLEERLLGVERLLERHPELCGRFTFIELAAPSRTLIERYRQLNDLVEAQTERINLRFGSNGYQPILLLREHHEPQTVFRYYRAADLCYVSSLHDGMNLVAKEFVSARDDERGVLVLSQFTGAGPAACSSMQHGCVGMNCWRGD